MRNEQVHPIFRTLVDRVLAPKDTGTNDTMPKHHWLHNVLAEAGVTAEQAKTEAERLTRWYNAGEPVWMAANGLREFFQDRAIHEREDRDWSGAKAAIRTGNRGGK